LNLCSKIIQAITANRYTFVLVVICVLNSCNLAGATRCKYPKHLELYKDTIAVARDNDCDYLQLLELCWEKDEAAIHRLFLLTVNAGFDAASAEGHADVLLSLLNSVGDEFFSVSLFKEEKNIQEEVKEYIQYAYAGDNNDLFLELVKKHLKTFGSNK